jgi:hypothetical protein
MISVIAKWFNAFKLSVMRKIASVFLLFILTMTVRAQNSKAENAAAYRTQRMVDSLQLSVTQKKSIYAINLALNNQKIQVKELTKNVNTLRVQLQAIEIQRDSLYMPVLTPAQFNKYQARKATILGY